MSDWGDILKEFGAMPMMEESGSVLIPIALRRMAEEIIELRKANGWKGPVDRKSYPKNHNTFKHSQPYMEELVEMLQKELGKHHDVPKIEYLTDELEKERAYSEKLREALMFAQDAIHDEFCSTRHHLFCVSAKKALALKPPGGEE